MAKRSKSSGKGRGRAAPALSGRDAAEYLRKHPKMLDRLVPQGARFVDPRTGRTFSQRAKRRAQYGQTPERYTIERRFRETGAVGAGENLERLIDRYRSKRHVSREVAVAKDSKFWEHLRNLRSADNSAEGPRAKALAALGLRVKGASYRVGESPTGRRLSHRQSVRQIRTGRR